MNSTQAMFETVKILIMAAIALMIFNAQCSHSAAVREAQRQARTR